MRTVGNIILYIFMSFIAVAIFLCVANLIGSAAQLFGMTNMNSLIFGTLLLTCAIAATGIIVLGLHLSTREIKTK